MIHTSYTVGITTAEFKALESVTIDQQEWIENAIKNRARIAIDNIQTNYTNFKISKGEAITAVGTTAIIEAAYTEGVVGILTHSLPKI
tara:strand:+ start:273 stop:536 length:264 start_codon:yes stop_codon:yes gene_type:complete